MKESLAVLVCGYLQVVLRLLADSRVLSVPAKWPRVPASARTSLACFRGHPAFAIERIGLPPSRALRAFTRDTGCGSEVLGCMDRNTQRHAAAYYRCRSDVGRQSCASGRLHLVRRERLADAGGDARPSGRNGN